MKKGYSKYLNLWAFCEKFEDFLADKNAVDRNEYHSFWPELETNLVVVYSDGDTQRRSDNQYVQW